MIWRAVCTALFLVGCVLLFMAAINISDAVIGARGLLIGLVFALGVGFIWSDQ